VAKLNAPLMRVPAAAAAVEGMERSALPMFEREGYMAGVI
jgi:hypothetical protein